MSIANCHVLGSNKVTAITPFWVPVRHTFGDLCSDQSTQVVQFVPSTRAPMGREDLWSSFALIYKIQTWFQY